MVQFIKRMTIMTLNTLTFLFFKGSTHSNYILRLITQALSRSLFLQITDFAVQIDYFLQVINPNKSSFQ